MTIILLCIFLYQAGVCVLKDEEKEAQKYGKLWEQFVEDMGWELD